jgi:GNAT superfamily N-acetyltransferase
MAGELRDDLHAAWAALAGQDADPATITPARNDTLEQHKSLWEAVRGLLTPASAATNPDTPDTQRAYGRALSGAPGKLPPVPGSPVFDPGTGAAVDAAATFLPELKAVPGLLGGAKAAAGAVPAFIRRAPLSRLGGDAAAREAFERYVAPHFTEDQFADRYFAGMHHPDSMGLRSNFYGGDKPSLEFAGNLLDPRTGRVVGSIERSLYPGEGYASHNSLELKPSVQGHDIGKRLLSNQIDAYRRMGMGQVEAYANVDVGGYAWSKYGFVPDSLDTWRDVGKDVDTRMAEMSKRKGSLVYGRIGATDRRNVSAMLRADDPHMIWNIADLDTPAGANDARGKPMTLGKALLLGQGWTGKLDMTSDAAMRRFEDYVRR